MQFSSACRSTVVVWLLVAVPALAFAGQGASALGAAPPASPPAVAADVTITGPPPPVPPAVQTRDLQGGSTIRAIRLTQPLRLDGRLDEEVYETVEPIGGFLQLEPLEGQPASEKTDIWITFDDNNVYVTVRCWDSTPESNWIVTEMRRDSLTIGVNENVAFLFDTFYDKRNAVEFEINPVGGVYDSQSINGRFNADWNPIWSRQTGRFEGGWTAEMAIPFKTLRYRTGAGQVWGFNMRRTIRHKNEETFLTRVPRRGGANARGSISQVANGATLVGIDAPPASKNLELKPYALSSVSTDRLARPVVSGDLDGNAGFDVKYGITPNLTADFTYRTDFAQVEVDTQQVNLTRFSLFFPEKREFFLEGQGIFDFGGQGAVASGGQGAAGLTPLMFFSRRIGLNNGRAIPIEAGGRITGKVGKYSIGILNVLAGDEDRGATPQTNFSVVRFRRDILRRSAVGVMYTNRSVSALGTGSSQTYGADVSLGFYNNLNFNAYLAKSENPGVRGDDMSSRAQMVYNGGTFGAELDHLRIGDNFNPDLGFMRRDDVVRSFGSGRYSPRLTSIRHVRRFTTDASFEYITDGNGRLETREGGAGFGLEFDNNDTFNLAYNNYYELLDAPFNIATGVRLPVGAYNFQDGQVSYTLQNTHQLSGTVSLARGSFYNGDKTTLGLSGGRLKVTPRIALEPGASINWVTLEQGEFTSSTVSTRLTYTFTPLMFFSGFVQHNSSNNTVSTNFRFRWEYFPGSEFFVVYTDERDTLRPGYPDLRNRAFVVKVNRLVRF
jgi:hypothetical protein